MTSTWQKNDPVGLKSAPLSIFISRNAKITYEKAKIKILGRVFDVQVTNQWGESTGLKKRL